MKLSEILNEMFEPKPEIDLSSVLDELRSDLKEVGIDNPSFMGGFCFHAASRIFDALHAKYPKRDFELRHSGGHVWIQDYDSGYGVDSRGYHKGTRKLVELEIEGSIINGKHQQKCLNF
jgi:hypothetical protein